MNRCILMKYIDGYKIKIKLYGVMSDMKSIYILLTKSDTYISKMIGLVTSDPYTHVSISFEENLRPMYSFSRKYIHSPLPAGLRVEPLDYGFYKKYDYIPCALYELKVTDEVYEAAKKEVDTMMNDSRGYYFSVIGLFLCRLRIPLHRRRHLFCSQFVGEILHRSNALELPKDTSLMRPNDYSQLPDLTCRFQGRIEQLVEEFIEEQCQVAV